MQIKFIYPPTTQSNVVLRGKKTGCIKRTFSYDMPVELLPHIQEEDFKTSISQLNKVWKYTMIGQGVSLLPSLIAGAVIFGVGQANRSGNSTPIYWYIGILILGITFICFLLILFTLKSKFIRNLAMQVAKEHTRYMHRYGIGWSLRYVDFMNHKSKKKVKVWCELSIPNSPLAQQPIVPHPNPYPNLNPNQMYIPMTQFNGQQNPQQLQPNQMVGITPAPYNQSMYPGQGHQIGGNSTTSYMNEIPIDSNQIPPPQPQQQQYQPVNLSKQNP